MKHLFHSHHPFRIFLITGLVTIASLALAGYLRGTEALFLTVILIIIEITFSFDNAIINAKILRTVSKFWQDIFMTIGIFIAVFGMRLVFPIVIVMITAGLSAGEVINLALTDEKEYGLRLEESRIPIAAFGGMFLMMLTLQFFFDPSREIRWLDRFERWLQRFGAWWMYIVVGVAMLLIITALPFNEHRLETLTAGGLGILTYVTVHGLVDIFARRQERRDKERARKLGRKNGRIIKTGLAGFTAFMYLEVLDASFSFDSVIGAFAITTDVVLIAIGLGVGALWVRSLTLYMVRRETLDAYKYLEHGAHYTIALLAVFLLSGVFVHIPEAYAGFTGLAIIVASIIASVKEKKLNDARA